MIKPIHRKASRRAVHKRIRRKVAGTAERPRLSVHFSGRHIYAQVVNDEASRTLVHVFTTKKDGVLGGEIGRANVTNAEKVGRAVAEQAIAKDIKRVVFDRGGFIYHGKVKALADAARAAGLEF